MFFIFKIFLNILLWYFVILKYFDVVGIVEINKMRLSFGELSGIGFVFDGIL